MKSERTSKHWLRERKKRNKNYTRTRAFTMTNSELCGGGGGGTKHRPTRPLSEKEKGDTPAKDMGIG